MESGYEMAWMGVKNHELIFNVFGEYPAFEDGNIASVCMHRGQRPSLIVGDEESGERKPIIDVVLEINENSARLPSDKIKRPDYTLKLVFLDVRSARIQLGEMVEDSYISEVKLQRGPDGGFLFDVEPFNGLEVQLTCADIEVISVAPRRYYK